MFSSFLLVADQEQYHLIGSEEPIKAQVGSDVVLPCSLKPPADVRDGIVEWMFNFSKTVHLFLNKADDGKSQDERYKNRTILNHKMLKHGNVSLKLTDVTKNDTGNYTCIVQCWPDLSKERIVTLVVVDGNGNPNGIPGGGKGDNNNGTHPGVNVPVVVGSFIIIFFFIIICVVCRRRVKQFFPCWSNNSQNEEVRNDGDHRGNGNQGDEAEEIHLRIQEEPNQSV